MAIAFARAEYKSRASGGNAVRSAAYNSRSDIRDERTGDRFDFSHQAKVGDVHLGVLLPDGARADFMDPATLWNAAEKAERRKDSQVAREVVIALPKEGSREDHITLARTFAMTHFVSKGVAAQVDIHAPDGDGDNWHAHILITTRRVTAQGLEAKKARDLDPVIVSSGGRAKVVSEEERWGQLWAEHQNEYFKAQGLDLRVDRAGAVSQEHLGPKRFRAPEAQEARDERAEAEARTLKAWRDPASVLDLMTRTRSTFTTADLDRELAKALPVEEERAAVRAAVLAHPALVRLRDADGAEIDRFSTVDVISQERRTLADAASVAQRRHAVGAQQIEVAIEGRTMRPDQLRACHAAWSGDGLVVIEGRAGVGKSYAIGAIAEGYSRSGYTVVGLGPTNLVGLELAAEAHVSRGGTLHSELWHVEQGKRIWNTRTVVIVDEAAMVDSRTMGRLMAAAARSGAKVVLVGDDRQLASVERGGLFSELRDRHGSVVIETVTRQRQDWQREAAEDLAAGRHDRAVQAFADRGCIRWTQTQDDALGALVGQWARDTADRPGKSRFVFAYTNDDVDKLNMALRLVRGLRGELGGDHALVTDRGVREFAVGDRVQISRTDKSVGMVNGTVGTITGIRGSHVMMRLDNGKTVAWNAEEFGGFRHGYAGTIYKGQGRTIDETYLYHSHHWRSAASYVALTRQRDSALVFAATETATDTAALARQMARADDRKAASAYVPEAEWFQARAQEEAARKVAEAEAQARAAAERRAALETVRDLKRDLATVQGRGEWLRAGEIAYGELPEAWKRLEALDPAAAAAEREADRQAAEEETRRWQAEKAAAEAARKAQEQPVAPPAPTPPPPAQTASTARPAGLTREQVQAMEQEAADMDRALPLLLEVDGWRIAAEDRHGYTLERGGRFILLRQGERGAWQWADADRPHATKNAITYEALTRGGTLGDARARLRTWLAQVQAQTPAPATAQRRETLDAMLARLDQHRRIVAEPRPDRAQAEAARRLVADIPHKARPLVRAAHADAGMPEPFRARLEAAVTAPTMLERAYGLRALAADLAKTEKLASRWWNDRYRLEQDAVQANQKATAASEHLDKLLRQASRDPEGDRRVIDGATSSQLEAVRDAPEALVSALRGGALVGREERRQAQEAAQYLVTAALNVRQVRAAATVAADTLRQWDETPGAKRGATAYEQSQAANKAVGASPLDASYRVNEAAQAFEQNAPAHEMHAAAVPDDYRRSVFQQQQESARDQSQDYGPSL